MQYAGIREEHVARARRRRRVRRLAHGRDRDAGAQAPKPCSSACCPTTCAASPRAARSTRCSAARTAASSTTCSPTASPRSASSPSPTPPTTRRTWRGSSATPRTSTPTSCDHIDDYAMLAVQGPRAREILGSLADGRLPLRMHCCQRSVAGVPMLVCGTGYTGEDGVELLLTPTAPGRCGTRWSKPASTPGGPRRARHAAPRGLLPPVRQRHGRGRATRSRPAWAGAARRTPASSAPRRCAPPARPVRRRSSSPSP